MIRNAENVGFPAACNLGAAEATGELLVFLNPDAVVAPGWRDAIERPLPTARAGRHGRRSSRPRAARVVNTRGGVAPLHRHRLGGRCGGAASGAADRRREPGFVSGACLAIPRAEFERLGGFAAEFFLYHEDVDLSLRVRLAGGALGVVADARVDHDYDFDKGPAKWRYLERNRWATLLRVYPAAAAAAARPGARRDRAGADPRVDRRRLVPAEAAGVGRHDRARCRACCASGARSRPLAPSRPPSSPRALTPALDSAVPRRRRRAPASSTPLLRGYWRVVLRLLGG